jgi:hypothetical protein
MQIEPRPHVYIAGFAPVEPRMRKHNFSAGDQQSEKCYRGNPMGYAHQRGVALPARSGGHGRIKLGRRRQLAGTAISDWLTRIHKLAAIPQCSGILQQAHEGRQKTGHPRKKG